MFEKYSQRAMKAIMLAQKETRRLGHNFVGVEQILLGLIGEESCIASKTLKSMGVTFKGVREQVEKIIGRGSGTVGIEIPFTPRCLKMFKNAEKIAYDLDSVCVNDVHLLLGILEENDGIAVHVLNNLNVNIKECGAKLYKSIEQGECEQEQPQDMLGALGGDDLPGSLFINPSFIKLVICAQECAASFHHEYIGTEHMLVAITNDKKSRASKCLKLSDITNKHIREKVAEIKNTEENSEYDKLPYSENLKAIFKVIEKNANESMNVFIDELYILLAILDKEDCTAFKILKAFSLDLNRTKKDAEYMLKHFDDFEEEEREIREKKQTFFGKIKKFFGI